MLSAQNEQLEAGKGLIYPFNCKSLILYLYLNDPESLVTVVKFKTYRLLYYTILYYTILYYTILYYAILYILFYGLTYNMRGYFASCAVFSRDPQGRGKIRAMSKMSASSKC